MPRTKGTRTSPRTKSRVNKQKKEFTKDQKKALAALVEKNPVLWKLEDPNHKKPDALNSAWEAIGTTLGFPGSSCREAWRSMTNSRRYHMKPPQKKKKKSGDSGSEDLDDSTWSDSENQKKLDAWQFGPSMAFLSQGKPTRITASYPEMGENDCDIISEANSSSDSSDLPSPNTPVAGTSTQASSSISAGTPTSGRTSNYAYVSSQAKGDSDEKKLLSGLSELIELRKKSTSGADELTHKSIYMNLDRMLKKLPSYIVEELNMQFVNITYAELKKYEESRIVELSIQPNLG